MFNTAWIRSSDISGNTEVGHGSIMRGEYSWHGTISKTSLSNHVRCYTNIFKALKSKVMELCHIAQQLWKTTDDGKAWTLWDVISLVVKDSSVWVHDGQDAQGSSTSATYSHGILSSRRWGQEAVFNLVECERHIGQSGWRSVEKLMLGAYNLAFIRALL